MYVFLAVLLEAISYKGLNSPVKWSSIFLSIPQVRNNSLMSLLLDFRNAYSSMSDTVATAGNNSNMIV
jgi:hypothetical protein